MLGVRKLKSRTEAFWRDEYRVSEADVDSITSQILEAGKPLPLSGLVAAIIARRLEREKDAVKFEAEHGAIYQPKNHYDVGQKVLFTALDFAAGQVIAVRPGNDPKVGDFQVIRVAFDDGAPEREFAADFAGDHPLNRPAEELLGGTDPEVSDGDLTKRFEHYVARQLEPTLDGNQEFVKFNGLWFLHGLLPEIHLGHLNLAEAMIYEAGHPLAAREMLDELEIGGAATVDARLFALSHALSDDKRFDNLGSAENPIWYMRALEPAAVHARPAVLTPAFRATGGESVGITTLELIEEVGDELDDIQALSSRERTTFQCQLPFPHLYAGTLPATSQLLAKLPQAAGTHYPLTLIDTAQQPAPASVGRARAAVSLRPQRLVQRRWDVRGRADRPASHRGSPDPRDQHLDRARQAQRMDSRGLGGRRRVGPADAARHHRHALRPQHARRCARSGGHRTAHGPGRGGSDLARFPGEQQPSRNWPS